MSFVVFFRSFARRQVNIPKKPMKVRYDFNKLITDKQFLRSIGIEHFIIDNHFNFSKILDIYDEKGELLGKKTMAQAKSLSESSNLDLVLVQEAPPVLQLVDYKKIVLKHVRITQNKLARRAAKEMTRIVSISNNIAQNDLKGKLLKIRDFMSKN